MCSFLFYAVSFRISQEWGRRWVGMLPYMGCPLSGEVMIVAELWVLIMWMCQVMRVRMAESLLSLVIWRCNLNEKSSRRVFSLNCSIWPLAMPHFSANYSVNCPVSHHHRKPNVILPPGTKNSKAFGVWEGPKLTLPRSLSFSIHVCLLENLIHMGWDHLHLTHQNAVLWEPFDVWGAWCASSFFLCKHKALKAHSFPPFSSISEAGSYSLSIKIKPRN